MLLEPQAIQDRKVVLARADLLECLVHRDLRVTEDSLEHKALLVLVGPQGHQGQQDHQVKEARLVKKDF